MPYAQKHLEDPQLPVSQSVSKWRTNLTKMHAVSDNLVKIIFVDEMNVSMESKFKFKSGTSLKNCPYPPLIYLHARRQYIGGPMQNNIVNKMSCKLNSASCMF